MSDRAKAPSETAKALRQGAETTANGLYRLTSYVARNDGRIADGAQAVTRVVLSLIHI